MEQAGTPITLLAYSQCGWCQWWSHWLPPSLLHTAVTSTHTSNHEHVFKSLGMMHSSRNACLLWDPQSPQGYDNDIPLALRQEHTMHSSMCHESAMSHTQFTAWWVNVLIRNEPMGKSCPPGALLQCLPHANQTARSRVMTRHREEACFLIIGKLTLQQTIQRFGGFTSVLPGEPGGHTSLTPSGGLPCLQTKTKKSCQCLTCLHNDVCSYVLKNPLPKEIFS